MQSGIECCHMKSAGLLIGEICFHANRCLNLGLVLLDWFYLSGTGSPG